MLIAFPRKRKIMRTLTSEDIVQETDTFIHPYTLERMPVLSDWVGKPQLPDGMGFPVEREE